MKRKIVSEKSNDYPRTSKGKMEQSELCPTPHQSPNFSTNLFTSYVDIGPEETLDFGTLAVAPQTSKSLSFGKSVLDKYRQTGFLADAQSSTKCWDFSCIPERTLRISIPATEIKHPTSNWIHIKIYKEFMGQMKFHQLLILSTWEMRRVLSSLDEVLQEARNLFEENSNEIIVTSYTAENPYLNFPTPLEDSKSCAKFWELCETARRKICASMTVYDKENFYRSYIQLKLYTRVNTEDNFVRKGCINMKKGEVSKCLNSKVELMETFVRETLTLNKKLTTSVSLPSLFM